MTVHGWLNYYAWSTPGCEAGCDGTWLMLDSAPRPDADLRILPECGGQSSTQGPYVSGAPELAVEVCGSSRTYDFGPKLALYQRAGVQEYITISIEANEVIWRRLVGGRYSTIDPGPDGLFCSVIFPGLWLDPVALLAGDGARLRQVLESGLASAEHAAFVPRLGYRAN